MSELNFLQDLRESLGVSAKTFTHLLVSLAVILAAWVLRFLMVRALDRRVRDVHTRYRWRKTTTYIVTALALIALTRVWIAGFSSVSTMLGLISAGLAIALRDPLVNLAGWLFILWRQPFSVGDRIEVGKTVAGDVIDQRLFAFTLMEIGNWVNADQSTGRIIHVPNGRVFTEQLANYSKGFKYIWDELSVLVTFESNWRKAKGLLEEIVGENAEHLSRTAETRLREASRKFMIFYSKLTPIVYTSVQDSGVMLTLRYLTEPQKRRGRKQAIWEDILDAFAECDDIDFAYPTQRMYMNYREGKPGAKKDDAQPASSNPDEDLIDLR